MIFIPISYRDMDARLRCPILYQVHCGKHEWCGNDDILPCAHNVNGAALYWALKLCVRVCVCVCVNINQCCIQQPLAESRVLCFVALRIMFVTH